MARLQRQSRNLVYAVIRLMIRAGSKEWPWFALLASPRRGMFAFLLVTNASDVLGATCTPKNCGLSFLLATQTQLFSPLD